MGVPVAVPKSVYNLECAYEDPLIALLNLGSGKATEK